MALTLCFFSKTADDNNCRCIKHGSKRFSFGLKGTYYVQCILLKEIDLLCIMTSKVAMRPKNYDRGNGEVPQNRKMAKVLSKP